MHGRLQDCFQQAKLDGPNQGGARDRLPDQLAPGPFRAGGLVCGIQRPWQGWQRLLDATPEPREEDDIKNDGQNDAQDAGSSRTRMERSADRAANALTQPHQPEVHQ